MTLTTEQQQPRVVFVTGITGNLGGRIAADLLLDDLYVRVIGLARGEGVEATRARVLRVLARSRPDFDPVRQGERLTVLRGDITRSGLGLDPSVSEHLVHDVTHIIHAAATTRFDLPIEVAGFINARGTRHVLELARRAAFSGVLRHVAHVSTAYVCGVGQGCISEGRTDRPRAFSNTYEEAKWQGERVARSHMSDVPLSILRPSIIVGDSVHGRIASFNVLYVPLRLIHRGLLRELPGRPDATLDVVPIDYVSRAIRHLTLTGPGTSRGAYHIVAGPSRTTTVDHVVRRTLDYFGDSGPARVRYGLSVSATRSSGKEPLAASVRRALELYGPYFESRRWFDDQRATMELAPAGICAPEFDSYFDHVLAYCAASGWGRAHSLAA